MTFLRNERTIGYSFVFYTIVGWQLLILPDVAVQNPLLQYPIYKQLMLEVCENKAATQDDLLFEGSITTTTTTIWVETRGVVDLIQQEEGCRGQTVDEVGCCCFMKNSVTGSIRTT